jgi:hypothetical protein
MGVDTWEVGPGRKSGHVLREQEVQSIRESKESIRPFPGDDVSKGRRNGRGGDAHLESVEGHRHRASRGAQLVPIQGEVPLIRIPEDGHARQAWHDLLQQGEPLCGQLGDQQGDSGDVTPWLREARHDPVPHQIIGTRPDHDRNPVRRPACDVELRVAGQEEQDIHRPRDETRDHILRPSEVLYGSHVEHEIAILHPVQLLHAFEESLDRRMCEPCLGGDVVHPR